MQIENASSEQEFAKAVAEAGDLLLLAGVTNIEHQRRIAIVETCVKFFVEDRVISEIER